MELENLISAYKNACHFILSFGKLSPKFLRTNFYHPRHDAYFSSKLSAWKVRLTRIIN